MMNQRDTRLIGLGLLLAVAAALAGCGAKRPASGGADSTEPITLRVGFPGTGSGGRLGGPEGWAISHGLALSYLKPLGITAIKLIPLPNGPDINEAMAAKGVDIGLFGDAPAVVGRSVGIPDRVINIRSVDGNSYIYARKDGPKTVEELAGKSVGTQKGSIMARFLNQLLDEKGLTGKVRIVHLPSNVAEPAVQRGDIAAYAGGYGPLEETRGFRVLDEAKKHKNMTSTGLAVVRQDFLDAHPGFATAWNKMRVAGIDDIGLHKEEYYQQLAKQAKLPLPVYKKLYPATDFVKDAFLPRGIEQLNGTKDFLKKQRLLKNDFNLEEWFYHEDDKTASDHSASNAAHG